MLAHLKQISIFGCDPSVDICPVTTPPVVVGPEEFTGFYYIWAIGPGLQMLSGIITVLQYFSAKPKLWLTLGIWDLFAGPFILVWFKSQFKYGPDTHDFDEEFGLVSLGIELILTVICVLNNNSLRVSAIANFITASVWAYYLHVISIENLSD